MNNDIYRQNITTTNIIKETSDGYYQFNILDHMLAERKLTCFGDITKDIANTLIMQLKYLAEQDADSEITLYIDSPGGSVSAGLAIYDVIKALPCPIRTVCIGEASSFAAIIFMSGHHRQMLKHSTVMIHDPYFISDGLPDGTKNNIQHLQLQAEHLAKIKELLLKIIVENTHRVLEDVVSACEAETFFDAESAIQFGLADEIISTF